MAGNGGGGCADGVGALLGCVLMYWLLKGVAIVVVLVFAGLAHGCLALLSV